MGRYFIGENPSHYLSHSGRLGQRWGVRNGPPYPLNRETVSRAYGGDMKYGRFAFSRAKDRDRAYKNGLAIAKDQNDKEIEQAVKLCNPKRKGDKYRDYNCGYCTIAYDMRRRGYDVIAADKYLIANKDYLKAYSNLKLDDTTGFSLFKGEHFNSVSKPTKERSNEIYKWANSELKKQGIGARGMFNITFGDDVGHALNYEVTKSGVKLIDAQSGDIYKLSEITPYCTDVFTFRCDNIEPNYAYIKRKGMVLNA